MLNVLVADDEDIARNIIKILLKKRSDIALIYEAENGERALSIAIAQKPDIVFLDIEMPILNGISVANHMPSDSAVIFTTAYNEHAVQAFELNAVDYLLKPYSDDRFHEAVNRARERKRPGSNDFDAKIQNIMDVMKSKDPLFRNKKLLMRESKRTRFIDFDHITHVKGAGSYAEVHLEAGAELLFRASLAQIEKQLPSHQFVRIHKSIIVNLDFVSELKSTGNGDYSLILNNKQELPLSRRNKKDFEQHLI